MTTYRHLLRFAASVIIVVIVVLVFSAPTALAVTDDIAREAVHNAIKHARAESIQVSLKSVGDRVILSVEDDGRGFDLDRVLTEKGKGYSSYQDMRLYLESVGGRLEIETEAGKGARIRGEAPISGDVRCGDG